MWEVLEKEFSEDEKSRFLKVFVKQLFCLGINHLGKYAKIFGLLSRGDLYPVVLRLAAL